MSRGWQEDIAWVAEPNPKPDDRLHWLDRVDARHDAPPPGLLSTQAAVRAQTKENIVPSHMHPTQSGKRMSQGLDGVRKAARERKQERFTALLHHLSVDLLRDSFYALQRKASPGVDGVTWQEYETGLADRLIDLHSRVHRGAYRAQPSRRVY